MTKEVKIWEIIEQFIMHNDVDFIQMQRWGQMTAPLEKRIESIRNMLNEKVYFFNSHNSLYGIANKATLEHDKFFGLKFERGAPVSGDVDVFMEMFSYEIEDMELYDNAPCNLYISVNGRLFMLVPVLLLLKYLRMAMFGYKSSTALRVSAFDASDVLNFVRNRGMLFTRRSEELVLTNTNKNLLLVLKIGDCDGDEWFFVMPQIGSRRDRKEEN